MSALLEILFGISCGIIAIITHTLWNRKLREILYRKRYKK